MKLSEMLQSLATQLENSDNDMFKMAEDNLEVLAIVGEALVEASSLLAQASEEIAAMEPDDNLSEDDLQSVADLASALDSTDDPNLQKQASVLDELLLTVAATVGAVEENKKYHERRLDELKQKYEEAREKGHQINRLGDTEKRIKDSKLTDTVPIYQKTLSTRVCPDHKGTMLGRIGEDSYVCPLDNKTYDYRTGFKLEDGTQVVGGSVSEQTKNLNPPTQTLFDSREGRLGTNRP